MKNESYRHITRTASDNSWTVDAKTIDVVTYDLSVKNPNKAEEAAMRDPQEIMAEIAALDAERAEISADIRGLLRWAGKPNPRRDRILFPAV